MKGWFKLAVERDVCLVHLTMGGFFDSETIARLKAELVQAVSMLTCPPNGHVTLCDIRKMNIQSQERVSEFSRLVGADEIRSMRLAFVTGASLARLQARRLTDRAAVEFFSDPVTAREWLLDLATRD